MIAVPPGYSVHYIGSSTLVIKKTHEELLLQQGIADPERLINEFKKGGDLHQGRGTVPSIPLDTASGSKMLIRKYLRGGMVRFFNRDIYFSPNRPFNELSITVDAASHGIPTPTILAAVTITAFGPFCRGYLFSEELLQTCDLPSYLSARSLDNEEAFEQKKRTLLKRVASLIRSMHDNGFFHGDINLKNILIDTVTPDNIYIIDWDKSRRRESISVSERSANVRRFCRSMAKFEKNGYPLTQSDQALFITTYFQDKKEIKRCLQRLKISLALRKLFWKPSRKP